jgi:uncharacterized membrane protein YdjX (TVP38/TMEM64 family)
MWRKRFKLFLILVLFVTTSILLATIPSESLIEFVGSDNAFTLMFVLGGIGGLTTFTGLPYHLVLMSLASGGINPVLLGIATALGVVIGDSTMFLIGKKIKTSLSKKMHKRINSLAFFLEKYPHMVTPFLVTYGAVSPISNDFVVATLSIIGHKYWRTILPLTIGNMFYNIAIAFMGVYAYDMVSTWF